MDREEEIKNRLKELADLIKKHNYNYHTLDKPKISDQEFDKLVKENDVLEKKYPKLILKDSPNRIYGSNEINIPNAPAIKFLIGLPSPIEASIVKPNIANAKYSG